MLPKADVQIKRVPPAIELGASSNYVNGALDGSRPGTYYIDLKDTAELPRWMLPTLCFHEAIPGHHLQISIQQEAQLPFYRLTLGNNAYVEGWALLRRAAGRRDEGCTTTTPSAASATCTTPCCARCGW